MSKKLQGNGIWESSRMMLPQHRERIIENQKLYKKKIKPIIHEDEWELIFQNINLSLSEHENVKVVIFGEYEYSEVNGVVTSVSQIQSKFKIENDCGFEWVDFNEIVSVKVQ